MMRIFIGFISGALVMLGVNFFQKKHDSLKSLTAFQTEELAYEIDTSKRTQKKISKRSSQNKRFAVQKTKRSKRYFRKTGRVSNFNVNPHLSKNSANSPIAKIYKKRNLKKKTQKNPKFKDKTKKTSSKKKKKEEKNLTQSQVKKNDSQKEDTKSTENSAGNQNVAFAPFGTQNSNTNTNTNQGTQKQQDTRTGQITPTLKESEVKSLEQWNSEIIDKNNKDSLDSFKDKLASGKIPTSTTTGLIRSLIEKGDKDLILDILKDYSSTLSFSLLLEAEAQIPSESLTSHIESYTSSLKITYLLSVIRKSTESLYKKKRALEILSTVNFSSLDNDLKEQLLTSLESLEEVSQNSRRAQNASLENETYTLAQDILNSFS